MTDRLSDIRALPVQRRYCDIAARRIPFEELPAEQRGRATGDQPLFEVAISSEQPVVRWYGTEVLIHQRSAIDMTYLKRGAAVLVDHGGDQVGVIESAWLDQDNVLRGHIRFSRSARGQEVQRDVEDGIRRFISVGYQWNEARVAEQNGSEGETWHVTRWTPMEVSVVSVPADVSVGFGRNGNKAALHPFTMIQRKRGTPDMSNEYTGDAVLSRSERRERARREDEAAEITEMCVREGRPELAAEFIRAGMSANDVGRRLLNIRAAQSSSPADLVAPLHLGPRDRERYSIVAALRGALNIAEGRSELFNGLEREVHEEMERTCPKEYKRRGGVFVPRQFATRGVMDSLTVTAAKELVFTEAGPFVDLLRPISITARLGATFLPGLVGPLALPRQTAAATAVWVAENPIADVPESNLTTDLVTLSPKTIQATTAFTRQLLQQSSIDVDSLVRRDLAQVHALAIDRAALHGSGSGDEPAGLYTISGVNSQPFGGAPTFAKIVDAMTEVAKDNAFMGTLGWATTPGMAGKLMQTLVASAAGSDMIWTGTFENGVVGGYRAVASNQVRANLGAGNNEHGVLFGNWADLLIGTWGGFEVIVDPYSKKKRGIIEVTTFQMADIDVRHPESFVKVTGATL